ncbi:MAG: hypothetical protein IPI87_02545 [Betaproteobacteria bacterium]|nr:hypothetical protein [Betaproteobacteria bacterium]
MMSSLSFRAAIAVAALAATGVAQSQTAAPAPSPSQPTPLAVPQGVQPSGAQAATPPAPEAAKAAPGTEAPAAAGTPVEQKPRQRRGGTGKSNFMPANPDATPILPGQPPKSQGGQGANGRRRAAPRAPRQSQSGAQAGAANAAGQPPGGVQAGSGKGKRPAGMGRAFTSLQTQEEYAAYSAKARNVKTHGECKALLETTRKELEPRAKAENKPISINPTEICDSAKSRGRLTD